MINQKYYDRTKYLQFLRQLLDVQRDDKVIAPVRADKGLLDQTLAEYDTATNQYKSAQTPPASCQPPVGVAGAQQSADQIIIAALDPC
jgi:hypothetical protein